MSKVTGYKHLTDEQVALMNVIKDKGNELGVLITELQAREDTDGRAIAIAKTDLQTGIMWLVRSVAQPDSF